MQLWNGMDGHTIFCAFGRSHPDGRVHLVRRYSEHLWDSKRWSNTPPPPKTLAQFRASVSLRLYSEDIWQLCRSTVFLLCAIAVATAASSCETASVKKRKCYYMAQIIPIYGGVFPAIFTQWISIPFVLETDKFTPRTTSVLHEYYASLQGSVREKIQEKVPLGLSQGRL